MCSRSRRPTTASATPSSSGRSLRAGAADPATRRRSNGQLRARRAACTSKSATPFASTSTTRSRSSVSRQSVVGLAGAARGARDNRHANVTDPPTVPSKRFGSWGSRRLRSSSRRSSTTSRPCSTSRPRSTRLRDIGSRAARSRTSGSCSPIELDGLPARSRAARAPVKPVSFVSTLDEPAAQGAALDARRGVRARRFSPRWSAFAGAVALAQALFRQALPSRATTRRSARSACIAASSRHRADPLAVHRRRCRVRSRASSGGWSRRRSRSRSRRRRISITGSRSMRRRSHRRAHGSSDSS